MRFLAFCYNVCPTQNYPVDQWLAKRFRVLGQESNVSVFTWLKIVDPVG